MSCCKFPPSQNPSDPDPDGISSPRRSRMFQELHGPQGRHQDPGLPRKVPQQPGLHLHDLRPQDVGDRGGVRQLRHGARHHAAAGRHLPLRLPRDLGRLPCRWASSGVGPEWEEMKGKGGVEMKKVLVCSLYIEPRRWWNWSRKQGISTDGWELRKKDGENKNHDISYTVYILQFILLRSLSFQEEKERNIAIPFWLLFPQFFICCHWLDSSASQQPLWHQNIPLNLENSTPDTPKSQKCFSFYFEALDRELLLK